MPIDRYRPFVVAAALAVAICPPVAASYPGGGVTLFAAGDYRGASETFYGDVPSLNRTAVGNDHASSLRVAPGCVATLYEHHDYRGRSTFVDRDVPDLRRTEVGNDAVSSLRVHCDAYRGSGRGGRYDRAVTLFAAGDYRGTSETFYGDVPSLNRTAVGNDHASSLRVAPGCVATLYEHHEYRGRSTQVDRDVPDLRRTEVGNDAVSSLRIRCDSFPGNDQGRRGDRGVTLYAGGGFEGRSETFDGDDANLSNNRIGNDTASSVRVAPGCRAILYAGGDFRGRSVEITYDERNLGTTSVGNDAVSSLRVECGRRGDRWDDRRGAGPGDHPGTWRGPWDNSGGAGDYGGHGNRDDRGGVTLYRGGDFDGTRETFFGAVPDLSRTAVGNDEVSSVRVAPGCRVILYRHSDYRGESTVLTYDEPDLRRSSVGNDAASSIEVDCRR